MKKHISREKAEEIVMFAEKHNALVEQKEFKDFDRHVISTPDGTVALKSPKDESLNVCTIENFRGFDNKLSKIADKGVIRIKGYDYV